MTTSSPANGGYDSTADTLAHSRRVGELMGSVITALVQRSYQHDLSKTLPPEKALFDEHTPRLRTLAYGTPEYAASLADLGPALAHHYAHNPHHPEHADAGIAGMTLVDVIEMLADWKAATERMKDGGDLRTSILHNVARFRIDEQTASLLWNTADQFGWL